MDSLSDRRPLWDNDSLRCRFFDRWRSCRGGLGHRAWHNNGRAAVAGLPRNMVNQSLKDAVCARVLPRVQTPAQYLGGELNAVVKDHRQVRGRLCLAFPDTYAVGMSHHGLQVLYHLMNLRSEWACERAFAPWPDMEQSLRDEGLPLYSLESFTPLGEFDVVGFTLQYDLCYTGVLTMLDLAGIPLAAAERTAGHPLVIAGGPCAQNPEPMSRFIDLFVIGDGEEALPEVCDAWLDVRSSGGDRRQMLAEMARRLPFAYVPCCYTASPGEDGRIAAPRPACPGAPEQIRPAVVADLDRLPLPTRPLVPYIQTVQDRLAVEIMRGCPWRCRFCQSNPIKRPVRFRKVESIVAAALESYRNTGINEISLLSLSTSDYPWFDELMRRLQETLLPLGVAVSVPSLRVNEQLLAVGGLLTTERHSGLTLAPEAAREDMREQIGKRISDHDLLEGCRLAFERGFQRVKLYFMCGLPGERPGDLDGILELAEKIYFVGKQSTSLPVTVVASVSNFVPRPHTPFQWHAMQTREYFQSAHRQLRSRRVPGVQVKCHNVETSLLEGVLARGDRRLGEVIERAWRAGARFDAWHEQFRPALWWQAIDASEIDLEATVHRPYAVEASLPWDHIGIRQGRGYLEQEHGRSREQLAAMGCSECS